MCIIPYECLAIYIFFNVGEWYILHVCMENPTQSSFLHSMGKRTSMCDGSEMVFTCYPYLSVMFPIPASFQVLEWNGQKLLQKDLCLHWAAFSYARSLVRQYMAPGDFRITLIMPWVSVQKRSLKPGIVERGEKGCHRSITALPQPSSLHTRLIERSVPATLEEWTVTQLVNSDERCNFLVISPHFKL